MKTIVLWSSALLLATLTLTGCSSGDDGQDGQKVNPNEQQVNPNAQGDEQEKKGEDDPVVYMLPETHDLELTYDQMALVKKNNDFAFNLYRAINADASMQGKSNIVSPMSLNYVLGMLNDGAQGKTAEEITTLLGFAGCDKETVNKLFKALLEGAPKVDESVTIQNANMVAVSNDVELGELFRQEMTYFYQAELPQLDFTSPTAAEYINDWSSSKTDGMITSIVTPEELKNIRLALLNAVYFNATWTNKFDEKDTYDDTFNGTPIRMMYRKAEIQYAQNNIYSMVNIPYGSGDKWTMKILLPNDGKTVDDVINVLSQTNWLKDCRKLNTNIVTLRIPRFKTETCIKLNDIISGMGAPTMFTGNADFKLMTGNGESLFVSLLKQKAAAEISEEGTKMSAVTTATIFTSNGEDNSKREIDFNANRPFVYIVQETVSGAIFFMGTYRGS